MANRFDIKTKTFFQIPPKEKGCSRLAKDIFDATTERVVFMEQGFDLDDIRLITECVQVGELWYQFSCYLGYDKDKKLDFDFKRKNDCLMAQRELTRAWTRTGEFAYEDVPSGEGTDVQ